MDTLGSGRALKSGLTITLVHLFTTKVVFIFVLDTGTFVVGGNNVTTHRDRSLGVSGWPKLRTKQQTFYSIVIEGQGTLPKSLYHILFRNWCHTPCPFQEQPPITLYLVLTTDVSSDSEGLPHLNGVGTVNRNRYRCGFLPDSDYHVIGGTR